MPSYAVQIKVLHRGKKERQHHFPLSVPCQALRPEGNTRAACFSKELWRPFVTL